MKSSIHCLYEDYPFRDLTKELSAFETNLQLTKNFAPPLNKNSKAWFVSRCGKYSVFFLNKPVERWYPRRTTESCLYIEEIIDTGFSESIIVRDELWTDMAEIEEWYEQTVLNNLKL